MNEIFLGILSGTSLDAISIGAFSFSPKLHLYHADNFPFPANLQKICLQFTEDPKCDLLQFGELRTKINKLFADTILQFIKKHNIDKKNIRAIGLHGPTIQHRPNVAAPFTMQLEDPNIIAYHTKITTVSDFRGKDIAAGGQGAPLASGFHAAMFRSDVFDRIIVNIGGISNITILPKNKEAAIIGFDIGPGNCLLDLWAQKYFNKPYDEDGNIASTGNIIPELLTELLNDQYFSIKPPKSTGREYFNHSWLNKYITTKYKDIKIQDILATLVHLTSTTICDTIANTSLVQPEIYLCGGGVYNKYLLQTLQQKCNYPIQTTSALGISPEWGEAGLFAWLAKLSLNNIPGNIPSVTGAHEPVVLGNITLGG